MSEIAGAIARGKSGAVAHIVQVARMCVTEARPVVQIVFLMRFMTGLLFQLPGTLSPLRAALGAVAWVLAVLAAYLVNGVMDVTEDRANDSIRPIARGDLPVGLAATIVAALAAGALLAGAAVPGLDWDVLAMLVLGYAYSGPPLPAKRTTFTAAATVTAMGLTTYLGGALSAGGRIGGEVLLFGIAMSLWMGCVGAIAKDLGDVRGDALAGRRTLAVVRGERAARIASAVGALSVATGMLLASGFWAPICLAGAVPLAAGAVWVALRCRHPRAGRGPYRAFMVTQYATHAAMLVALAARLTLG
ncbi:4-hydroxybenzoate polyprenyltransferase [Streptacidiphilus sp. MAP12-20]|uniref:UbiA family prenyltransferase n=1 Tax=Streptacidiphilus sp. MAP12-20 TaxID=3156299 RepID=UPI003512F3F6